MQQNIQSANQGSGTITCTPHFKEDIEVDKSWVTADMGPTILSFYLHPKSEMTLEDAVKMIETYSSTQFTNSLNTNVSTTSAVPGVGSTVSMNSQYTVTVSSAVIRGDNIQRHDMWNKKASECLHDGEAVSLSYYYNWKMNTGIRQHHPKCVIL